VLCPLKDTKGVKLNLRSQEAIFNNRPVSGKLLKAKIKMQRSAKDYGY